MSKRYKVTVQWSVVGTYYVEADDADHAHVKVEADSVAYPLPVENAVPVDGTFQIHEHLTEEMAPE